MSKPVLDRNGVQIVVGSRVQRSQRTHNERGSGLDTGTVFYASNGKGCRYGGVHVRWDGGRHSWNRGARPVVVERS